MRHARRDWSTLFGFGTIAGNPAEAHAFLQRRVSLYVGLTLGLWTVGSLVDVALGLLPGLRVDIFHRTLSLELAGTTLLAALLLVARRSQPSLASLHAVDAGGTILQAFMLGAILTAEAPETRPEFGPLLGLAHILVARAAIVPSTPMRTAAIGAATGAALVVAVGQCYLGQSLPERFPSPWVFVVSTAAWMSMTTLSTTVISHVIYGLRQKVTAALALGQYTLEEKLGEGGMGIVYRARHGLMKRPAAVKILPPERAGAAAIARFEREVELTSRLTHPNTIAIHDFGHTADGVFYYVMEYVEGIDLGALVRLDGRQPAGRVLHLLMQAASALEEAHEAGLVHRDVKPENLLVCNRGRVGDFLKVLDFGLVMDVSAGDHVARAEGALGTPLYMAPEVISGGEVDARSDIYALGAVAYHLLAGSPVFDGNTIVDVCARHLHAPVEPLDQRAPGIVPGKLASLVESCLAKSPAERPQSVSVLLEKLAACDDVSRWTADDARRWWTERGAPLKERIRRSFAAENQTVAPTLQVDLAHE